MPLDPAALNNVITGVTVWSGAFLAALWLSLILWTFRDIRSRARDPLARLLSIVVVAVFFLPGLVIYLIMRPPQTMEEEYQHTLEEEALLQAIEDSPLCPGCGRRVKDAWIICPNCQTKLKKPCHHCSKLMELPWNICPFCGTPAPGMRRENVTIDEAMQPLPVEETEAAI
jgi:RNA polymerase subunit RPABC4/transcription elongation factor Spt4